MSGFAARDRWRVGLVMTMAAAAVLASVVAADAALSGVGVCSSEYDDDPFVLQRTRPAAEIMDGLDNDCDGVVDNGNPDPVVQLALVAVTPDTASAGDAIAVTALARTHPLADPLGAEYRIGDSGWLPMPSTQTSSSPRDYALSVQTAAPTWSGGVDVCVRASAYYGFLQAGQEPRTVESEEVCVPLTVSGEVTFDGFYTPAELPDQQIAVRAGRSLPLKFKLSAGSDPITDVAAVAVSSTAGCGTDTAQAGSRAAESAGHSGLRYDHDDGHFILAWQTDRSWATTCRTVEVHYDGVLAGWAEILFVR